MPTRRSKRKLTAEEPSPAAGSSADPPPPRASSAPALLSHTAFEGMLSEELSCGIW